MLEIVHKGFRHQWHERTLELSKLYRALVTGDGLDELLKQFVQRESDDDFAQRKALTTHIATTVTSNIMDVFYKVPRSNYQRILEHIGENGESKTIELEAKLAAFWGKKDLDTYMKSRWLKINATDPNAFIVVEFKPFDHTVERASPYPWEVTSEQAVDFEYQNNVLQHLAVQTHFKLALKDGKETTADK